MFNLTVTQYKAHYGTERTFTSWKKIICWFIRISEVCFGKLPSSSPKRRLFSERKKQSKENQGCEYQRLNLLLLCDQLVLKYGHWTIMMSQDSEDDKEDSKAKDQWFSIQSSIDFWSWTFDQSKSRDHFLGWPLLRTYHSWLYLVHIFTWQCLQLVYLQANNFLPLMPDASHNVWWRQEEFWNIVFNSEKRTLYFDYIFSLFSINKMYLVQSSDTLRKWRKS